MSAPPRCRICGDLMLRIPGGGAPKKTCSARCRRLWRLDNERAARDAVRSARPPRYCSECDKLISEAPNGQTKTCSVDCSEKRRRRRWREWWHGEYKTPGKSGTPKFWRDQYYLAKRAEIAVKNAKYRAAHAAKIKARKRAARLKNLEAERERGRVRRLRAKIALRTIKELGINIGV